MMNSANQQLFELYAQDASSEDIIKFALTHENSIDIEETNSEDRSILRLSVMRGDVDLVNFWLDDFAAMVDAASGIGVTALHMASQRGYLDIVQTLLNHHANVNSVLTADGLGNATPLILAVKQKQKAVVEVLARQENIDLNAKFAPNGYTALQIAIAGAEDMDPVWLKMAGDLIQAGASINSQSIFRNEGRDYILSSMNIGICSMNPEMVSLVLKSGFVEDTSEIAGGVLHIALQKLSESYDEKDASRVLVCKQIINLLIDSDNISKNVKDSSGRDPMLETVVIGDFELATQMLETGKFPIDTLDVFDESTLSYVVTTISSAQNQFEISADSKKFVETYLDKIDLETLKIVIDTTKLLNIAISNNLFNIFNVLLNIGVALEGDEDGNTPLHFAAMDEVNPIYLSRLMTDIFVDRDISEAEQRELLNKQNNKGETALHLAISSIKNNAEHQILKVQDLLRSKLIDVNIEDYDGLSPLEFAIIRGANRIFDELISHPKIDLDESSRNLTPMHSAASSGNIYAVGRLYEKAPETASYKDNDSKIPLHHAAQNLCTEVIEFFARKDASLLEVQDVDGNTALHELVMSMTHDFADFKIAALLSSPIVLATRNEIGLTPMEFAAFVGNKEAIMLLFEAELLQPLSHSILDLAVSQGHIDLIKYLVDEKKMDLSGEGDDGCSTFFNLVHLYRELQVKDRDPSDIARLKNAIEFMSNNYASDLMAEEKYGGESALDILRTLDEVEIVATICMQSLKIVKLHEEDGDRDIVSHLFNNHEQPIIYDPEEGAPLLGQPFIQPE